MTDAQQVVDEIFGLYRQYGTDDYIGEPVSQIEHMSQAAQLALQAFLRQHLLELLVELPADGADAVWSDESERNAAVTGAVQCAD